MHCGRTGFSTVFEPPPRGAATRAVHLEACLHCSTRVKSPVRLHNARKRTTVASCKSSYFPMQKLLNSSSSTSSTCTRPVTFPNAALAYRNSSAASTKFEGMSISAEDIISTHRSRRDGPRSLRTAFRQSRHSFRWYRCRSCVMSRALSAVMELKLIAEKLSLRYYQSASDSRLVQALL